MNFNSKKAINLRVKTQPSKWRKRAAAFLLPLLLLVAAPSVQAANDGVAQGWVKSSEEGAPCLHATAAIRGGKLRLILALTPRLDHGFLVCDARWPIAETVAVHGVKAEDGTTMLLPQPGVKEHDEQVAYQNVFGAQFVGRRQGWALPTPDLDAKEFVIEMRLTDGNTATFKVKTKDIR